MSVRYPWTRILVPTDFSTAAEWVFDDAVHAARRTGAELLVLHVRMTRKAKPEELRYPADSSIYEYVEQHELDLLKQRILSDDPSVGTRLLVRKSPDPASEILATARDENVDLIVMATHARHHIAHLIIGSTTLSLLSRCTVPILAIRYGIRKPLSMKRILLAITPERSATSATALAAAIARDEGSAVTIAAADPAAVRRAFDESVQVDEVRLEPRNAGREIVRMAQARGSDLTVISTGCRPGEPLEETSEHILRQIGTPVLVVPEL